MPVRKVTTSSFAREVLESNLPVVVDFYADWCGPCRHVAPVVEHLSQEWDGKVRFAKVDIEREPRLAEAYRILSIPAVLLFEGGAPRAWSLGAKPAHALERELGLSRRRREEQGGGFFRRLFRGGPKDKPPQI